MTVLSSPTASPAHHPDSLGVIISLPPALAGELSRWRESYGGPAMAAIPPHITLVSGAATGSFAEAGAHVREVARAAAPFRVTLRGTGTFAPVSDVVFVKLAEGAQHCRELHEELVGGPLEHLLDFDFHPHLTVAHELDAATMTRAAAEMADFSASFQVRSIGLYDYTHGSWSLLEELVLGGAEQS